MRLLRAVTRCATLPRDIYLQLLSNYYAPSLEIHLDMSYITCAITNDSAEAKHESHHETMYEPFC